MIKDRCANPGGEEVLPRFELHLTPFIKRDMAVEGWKGSGNGKKVGQGGVGGDKNGTNKMA